MHTHTHTQELKYDVHFWIGQYSSQDEYGTAAYKTVELDTFVSETIKIQVLPCCVGVLAHSCKLFIKCCILKISRLNSTGKTVWLSKPHTNYPITSVTCVLENLRDKM